MGTVSLNRQQAAVTLVSVLLLICATCSRPVPGAGAPFREQTLFVTLGDVPVRIAASPVGRIATTLDSVVLDQPYTLEFLPLVEGDSAAEGLALNTYVVTASGGRLVSSDQLVPMEPLRSDLDAALNLLADPVSIDLSSYTDQTVALRWAVEPISPEPPAPRSYVAGFRLRPSELPAEDLPDILMICSDTHRFDFSLGARGRELMPNLQRLASQSLVYDWSFSASSWTLPSIASIFTGLPPRYHQTGRRTGRFGEDVETDPSAAEFGVDWGEPPYENIVLTRFPRELSTLPESLRKLGYSTAVVATNPMYYLSDLLVDGVDIPIGTNPVPGDRVNRIVRDVLEVLPGDGPLFLVVHYMDVHQWIQWHYDRDYPGSDARQDSPDVVLSSYAEPVGDADRFLGDLLDLWRESRSFDDSLIMFFADHGEHLLDPAFGHGNTMEDQLLHVPLVVKYPQNSEIAGGERVGTLVSLTDLMPTILQLVGAPIELPSFAGRSLLDAVSEATTGERAFIADFQLYDDDLASVRRGDYKLVVNLSEQTSRTTRWRTGDVLDPENDEQTALLAEVLAEYDREAALAIRSLETAPADTQDAIEALKSLGYIQ